MPEVTRIVSERGIFDTPVTATAEDVKASRDYVLNSKVLGMIKQWEIDDRKKAGLRGARGAFASAEQVLTLLLMLMRKEAQLTMTAATSMVYYGMKDEARDELGLNFSEQTVTAQQIYDRLYRSFHRFLKVIDPYPMQRRCLMTKPEFDALNEAADQQRRAIMMERCRALMNRMLLATIPRWVRRRSDGNVAVDGTFVPAYGQQGTKEKSRFVAIEPYGGYYVRSEDHFYDANKKYTKADIKGWGWEATLAVLGTNDPLREPTFPQLIAGINMTTPGARPGQSAIHALKYMHREHHLPESERFRAGLLAGDRVYGNTPKPENFQIPARAMGYGLLFDLKEQYWGETYKIDGAIMLEGNAYSPAIMAYPKLITATKDYYAADDDEEKIDSETYRNRLQQRAKFLVEFRTAQRADGSRQGICPALGPNPTLHCPLRALFNTTVSARGKTLLPIPKDNIPSEEFRGGLCDNKGGTMVLRGEAWDKHVMARGFQFGTEKWHKYYTSLRQRGESANATAKDSASVALASPQRRRIRGYAAALLFSTIMLMHLNLKNLARWKDPKMDSQGRGELRKPTQRRRESTNGPERPGILKGQMKPTIPPVVPYTKVLVGIE